MTLRPLILSLGLALATCLCAQSPTRHLLPQPQQLVWGEGYVRLSPRHLPKKMGHSAAAQSYLSQLVHPLPRRERGAVLTFAPLDGPMSDARDAEAYRLEVRRDTVRIAAHTDLGRLRALQTLVQLLDAEGRLPLCTLEDRPTYAWRGAMLDVSRHFYSVDFLKKMVRALAAFKVNRLHLHLTDAAGWRMQIERYPRLTQLGAWRTQPLWKDWWAADRKYAEEGAPNAYGGYYTKAQLRELVAFAADYGIEIMPEIEMPAHSEEVLAAYPELGCEGTSGTPAEFCPGREEVYTFLQNVLAEVIDVFPSRTIHIGGDEASKASWRHCPHCRAKMDELGIVLASTPGDQISEQQLHQLQAHFVRRMGLWLEQQGRQMVGWDEVVDSLLPSSAVVMLWRDAHWAQTAAELGHDVILSPASHAYLDAYQDAPASQPEAIGGYLPLSKVTQMRVEDFVADTLRHRVRGVQGNLWTEYISTPQDVERMLFPRIIALADLGWRGQMRTSEAFRTAIDAQQPLIDALGIRPFDLKQELGERPEASRRANHLAVGAALRYVRPYSNHYRAQGDVALIDGNQGGWSYHDGNWQGFLQTAQPDAAASDKNLPLPAPLDVVIDLGQPKPLTAVSASFMQAVNAWVHLPQRFVVSTSLDGQNFTPFGSLLHTLSDVP
ncbi:MAG: beta-N-acetylhexosaminidase, partial [Bacteroidaceae bacterium]|nr:beta-N-acetylhexosaminidase [Bacteroidaceae bacterium]